MSIGASDIQWLRQATGVGMMEAKRALTEAGGDREAAAKQLRKSGAKIAASKSERIVKEGVVGTYVHSNQKVAAMVALACETDFVARTEDFRALAHDLALHVTAANPSYLNPADIPPDVIEGEREVYRAQLKSEGKPEAIWDKIIQGKLEKFYSETCLMKQPYVKDDSLTIADLIQQTIAKIGENIRVTDFRRLNI